MGRTWIVWFWIVLVVAIAVAAMFTPAFTL
jgi:hypothetical protein